MTQKKKISTLETPVSAKQKLIFWLLILLFPLILLGLLEAGLQWVNYGGNYPLFIDASSDYPDYQMINPLVGKRYFTSQTRSPTPPVDLFLKIKPENGVRIFTMGGSSMAGYPYSFNVTPAKILQRRLHDIFPEKNIEVINTAMTAVNSYTLLDFTDEILAKEPDALLIYAGHNEYYGALGAASTESFGSIRNLVNLSLKLRRYKTFLLLRDLLTKISVSMQEYSTGGTIRNPNATLMARMVGEQKIAYGSPIFESGKLQFAGNLREIIEKARAAGVPVILSELVSNTRDQPPFVSLPGPDGDADKLFVEARKYEKKGAIEKARMLYQKAKDYDGLRFRAPEDFNQIIHQLADEYNLTVAKATASIAQICPNSLPGECYFLEHLHPNIDGYFALSDAFLMALLESNAVAENYTKGRIKPWQKVRKEWGVTELDIAYADFRIAFLKAGWPFKANAAPNMDDIAFTATTKAESLAVKTWQDKTYDREHAHVDLAGYFSAQGNYKAAFQEYRALIHYMPQNQTAYIRAAEMLINDKSLNESIPYLHQALKLGDSVYANKWLGQIYLYKSQNQRALSHLEKAAANSKDDPQLLYNLAGAYALNRNYKAAINSLDALDRIFPNYPEAINLRAQIVDKLK
ncbi:MAG: hypothetical protein DWQ05_06555 [Calditrichaeota bacterium]|nr:MAG: hypothetical protein DWQ05_06555 [Calditrichota bacterium]